MSRSAGLGERARRVMPGGVNSPVRSFRSVGGSPRFIAGASGSRVVDVDGRPYVDYVMGWGALLFGHAPAFIRAAVADALVRGVGPGVPQQGEVEFAERLVEVLDWPDQVRLANSGTEAVMTAVRLARAITGRTGVVIFDGGYHGHADVTLGSQSAGVPPAISRDIHRVAYDDLSALDQRLSTHGHSIAAVLVEPVAANMGVVAPSPAFLQGLRSRCDRAGALLVFDEVVTGFRVAAGGAIERFGIVPDIATYGKVVGGGMPIGAIAGPAATLSQLAPSGPVIHGGTFAGHPLTVAAGLAALAQVASEPELYARLETAGAALESGFAAVAAEHEGAFRISRVGSMWTPVFATTSDYSRFFHAVLDRGIHLAPSPHEANFISTAHTPADIENTVTAARDALSEIYATRR